MQISGILCKIPIISISSWYHAFEPMKIHTLELFGMLSSFMNDEKSLAIMLTWYQCLIMQIRLIYAEHSIFILSERVFICGAMKISTVVKLGVLIPNINVVKSVTCMIVLDYVNLINLCKIQ